MELRQLECFLSVAKELHFGRAAEKLHMGQSSVSESIKALERSIGGPLFERTSRRVSLTLLGETLLRGAGPAFVTLKSTFEECKSQASGRTRRLVIGFLGGGFYELYRPLVAEFAERYPQVELQFVELTYVTQFAAIVDGTVDAAFCRLPLGKEGLTRGPVIMQDQRMLCVPQDHVFVGNGPIDPERLADEKVVRLVPGSVSQEWEDFHFPRYTPQGKPIADGPQVRTIREALAAVSARQGLVMVTQRAANYYATPNVAFVEIQLPPIASALVQRADDARRILHEFNDILVSLAQRFGTLPVHGLVFTSDKT
ncbi:LysR family transcriptional regulator [Pseudomonas sp. H9]|uniref:LysR substrate-binding domain-containing protein n=1 Tax=Pseudomonas sp. H9 TaxID=483968 RepID=UPI001057B3AA|nr:LysR family transcriptional regulator [Pseudomonas sp. H9]TDF86720.1 LysR family transcriptional regulator [Pseudomonas sp. H9]